MKTIQEQIHELLESKYAEQFQIDFDKDSENRISIHKPQFVAIRNPEEIKVTDGLSVVINSAHGSITLFERSGTTHTAIF